MTPRPLDDPRPLGEPRLDALARLLAVVDRLRAPDGCPWDLEQTLPSLAPHLVEEAHELQEAIETGADGDVTEEAGDLLMGLVLIAKVASQERRFDLADVARAVSDKLVRRHPHVFGDGTADGAGGALANWEAVKAAERQEAARDASALAGLPVALPALQRIRRAGEKAIAAGFRWSSVAGARAKLEEELGELADALERSGLGDAERAEATGTARAELEHELGDVLLAAGFLGSYLGIDPEQAAREALRRFERRFRHMETGLGGDLRGRPLPELLEAWSRAKAAEALRAEPANGGRERP